MFGGQLKPFLNMWHWVMEMITGLLLHKAIHYPIKNVLCRLIHYKNKYQWQSSVLTSPTENPIKAMMMETLSILFCEAIIGGSFVLMITFSPKHSWASYGFKELLIKPPNFKSESLHCSYRLSTCSQAIPYLPYYSDFVAGAEALTKVEFTHPFCLACTLVRAFPIFDDCWKKSHKSNKTKRN